MLIKIVYDNTSIRNDMQTDWGFAAVIEFEKKMILFDAGADGNILLHNMQKMGIDPTSIDTVFISHHHFDHTGGLAAFLAINNKVTVYVPESLRGVRNAAKVIHVSKPVTIGDRFHSTGELKGIEQSLIIESENGIVIVAGCSHPGLRKIMKASEPYGKIYAVVGGFHAFKEFDILKNIRKICPTHCTQAISELKEIYPDKYISGGAGKIIEL